jgi:hypothetical protein
MTDLAAISGNYADFKLVKTRSVAQVIIELPIERAEAFLKAFGVPQPGAEKPVALALLNTEQPKAEKPKQSWSSMSRAQQAGILAADKRFQQWLEVPDEESAAEYIRSVCGVTSRRLIDGNLCAEDEFKQLMTTYRTATGQQAEQR